LLPFLKKNKESGAAASTPVQVRDHDEDFSYDSMESAAADLLQAIKKDDVQGVAAALRAAHDLADIDDDQEGEHE
jgi:hypothetical protein